MQRYAGVEYLHSLKHRLTYRTAFIIRYPSYEGIVELQSRFHVKMRDENKTNQFESLQGKDIHRFFFFFAFQFCRIFSSNVNY